MDEALELLRPGAVGVGLEVDTQKIARRWGDRLLLSSNGVFTVLDDDQISEVLRRETNLDQLGHALIQGANDGGGPGNVTGIVLALDAGLPVDHWLRRAIHACSLLRLDHDAVVDARVG